MNTLLHCFFLVIALVPASLRAADAQKDFAAANTLYGKKEYNKAAAAYERLLAQGYRHSDLYFNLGNCQYKLGQTGKSILSYERALRLSPNDEDVLHNLKMAQLQARDKIQGVPQPGFVLWWQRLVESRSATAWSIWAIMAVWVALLFFAVRLLFSSRGFLLGSGSVLIVVSLFFLLVAGSKHKREQNPGTGIVTVGETFIKSAPDENSTSIFQLHEGAKIFILDKVNGWVKFRLADGKIGWISTTDFENI